jgi:hypothetical protein
MPSEDRGADRSDQQPDDEPDGQRTRRNSRASSDYLCLGSVNSSAVKRIHPERGGRPVNRLIAPLASGVSKPRSGPIPPTASVADTMNVAKLGSRRPPSESSRDGRTDQR